MIGSEWEISLMLALCEVEPGSDPHVRLARFPRSHMLTCTKLGLSEKNMDAGQTLTCLTYCALVPLFMISDRKGVDLSFAHDRHWWQTDLS